MPCARVRSREPLDDCWAQSPGAPPRRHPRTIAEVNAGLLAALLLTGTVPAYAEPTNVRGIDLSVSPAELVAGMPATFAGTIAIDGAAPSAPFFWSVRLTVGGVLEGSIDLGPFGPIEPGPAPAVITVSETVVVPAFITGLYRPALVADAGEDVAESNEYDNAHVLATYARIREPLPDLAVRAVRPSIVAQRAADPVGVEIDVENLGEVGANARAAVYLSRDGSVSPSDIEIGAARLEAPSGARATVFVAAAVPAGLEAGDYTFGVVLDPEGEVSEVSETNNARALPAPFNVFHDTLALSSESLPGGTLTVPYHARLDARGGDGHYRFTVADGALPDGLALEARTGEIAGVPRATGRFMLEVRVESRGLEDRRAFSLPIDPTGIPLVILSRAITPGFLNRPYQQLLGVGGGEPPYTWDLAPESGPLPPGLDLGATGVISGAPSMLGRFTFSVTVEDRLGARDAAEYTLEVTPATNVTVLLAAPPPVAVGEPLEFQLEATGGIPPYTWESDSRPPPGLSLGEGGRLHGTPSRVGRWPFRVRARDSTRGTRSDTALVHVIVEDRGGFEIATRTLPKGLVRAEYRAVFETAGGAPPFVWRVVPGTDLPAGFLLAPGDGERAPVDAAVLSGVGFRPFTHAFAVRVEDAFGRKRELAYALTIDRPEGVRESSCRCAGATEDSAVPACLLAGLLLAVVLRRPE